ncbi:unnamed protein product [Caenorhabditis angaria]|uniref:Rho-GAP domain-containing protein n=1 Tax=Caenorhabditis angaria TaxID=860376 RepID=A0A9P1ICT9_9PELO|nr:unnamed protein product [Caenorhabditis angaria]
MKPYNQICHLFSQSRSSLRGTLKTTSFHVLRPTANFVSSKLAATFTKTPKHHSSAATTTDNSLASSSFGGASFCSISSSSGGGDDKKQNNNNNNDDVDTKINTEIKTTHQNESNQQRSRRPTAMTVASYSMVLCGTSDDHRYRGRIEKVKFGVPINEAFAHDIPATLLMLLLKVNKDGPTKKDIWRAPGNQAQVRKLSSIMAHGRLVNIENFTVYTAASVIKKFLSKLPGGIFGQVNEETLFNSALNGLDSDKQRQVFYRIFGSLPVGSQHLLVLLFGTFKIVANTTDGHSNSMNPNAIAISVAPSLFHTCITEGRQARVEDLQRFKLASDIVRSIICSFGDTKLFPRECYEYYARYTGRTLRIDENRMFTFHNPSNRRARGEEFEVISAQCAGAYSLAALHLNDNNPISTATTATSNDLRPTTSTTNNNNINNNNNNNNNQKSRLISRAGSLKQPNPMIHTTDHPKRSFSIVAEVHPGDLRPSISCFYSDPTKDNVTQENRQSSQLGGTAKARCRKDQLPFIERINNRLSSSVGEVLHEGTSDIEEIGDLDLARPITACGGDRSLSYLQYVHDNQARRMKSRSEWFLSPNGSKSVDYCTLTPSPPPLSIEVPQPKPRVPLQTSAKSNMSSNDSLPRQTPDRRKSLKFRTAAFAAHPSHSLDYDSTPNRFETSRLRSHTSVEAETWLTDVVSSSTNDEEIPKKRRSLKKKTSTKF